MQTKIKNAFKKHLSKKSHLFAYLRKKSLHNGNVDLTKLGKVFSALYKQKLVYQNSVEKQNYLNDRGPTKVVNVLTYKRNILYWDRLTKLSK